MKKRIMKKCTACFIAFVMLVALGIPNVAIVANAETAYVAEVYDADGNLYGSYTNARFASAVNVAAGMSGTVRLIDDVDSNTAVIVSKNRNVTIDLNGFELKRSSHVIQVSGSLVLDDSSQEKTGTVITPSNTAAGIYVGHGGSVVVNNGNIKGGYGIYANSKNPTNKDAVNGRIVVNGGNIQSNQRGVYLRNGFEFTMNGGEINVAADANGKEAYGIHSIGSKVTINKNSNGGEDPKVIGGHNTNGIFIGDLYIDKNNTAYIKNHPNSIFSELVMNGGTVHTADRFAISTNNNYSAGCKATISGGSAITDNMSAIYWPSEGELNIKGDAEITGFTAVDVRMGTLNISENAKLTGTGDYKDYYFTNQFSGSCPDGSALRITAEIYGDPSKAGVQYIESSKLTANITGGSFNSAKNNAINVYTCGYSKQTAEVNIYADDIELIAGENKRDIGYLYEEVKDHGEDYITSSDITDGIQLTIPERTTIVNIYGNGLNNENVDSIDSKKNIDTSADEWEALKTITYVLTGDVPDGVTAPESVQHKNNTPYQTTETYTDVEVEDEYGNVSGRYTFEGWDYNSNEPVRKNQTITGIWSFNDVEVPTHDVIYSWRGLPVNTDFYDEDGNTVNLTLPASITGLVNNQPYTLTSPAVTTVYTHDEEGNNNGVYTLNPWANTAGQVMGNDDIVVTGIWSFTPIESEAEEPVTPILPAIPATPNTPAASGGSPVVVPAAPAGGTVVIPDNNTPLAGVDNDQEQQENQPLVEIEDEKVPLANAGNGSWALMNLIFAIATVILGAVAILVKSRKTWLKAAAALISIASVVIFFFTENMSLTMVMTDKWTLAMAAIALVNAVVLAVSCKLKEEEEDQRV